MTAPSRNNAEMARLLLSLLAGSAGALSVGMRPTMRASSVRMQFDFDSLKKQFADTVISLGNSMPKALPMPSASLRPGGLLKPGDTVTVIGASGNVGKLVALRLAEKFKVRGVVRDASRVKGFLPESVELFEADLRAEDVTAELRPALTGAHAMVVCTGTTAFPTQAWSPTGRDGVALPVLKALFSAQFNVVNAIRILDEEGFNTPKTVDELGNLKLLKAWEAAAGNTRKQLVLLSSTGVQRRAQMPYPILNACGVLDAKAAAEAAIVADAAKAGYRYTIVRPGQLFGGPYDNNYYLGTLFQVHDSLLRPWPLRAC
jgi:hypothetical protein